MIKQVVKSTKNPIKVFENKPQAGYMCDWTVLRALAAIDHAILMATSWDLGLG
jgi:hypothetical protein